MTVPAGQPAPPFNIGNRLLAEQPADLVTAIIDTPGGQRLAMTVRTPSGEQSVFLAKKDADAWAAQLTGAAGTMSASGLVVANGSALSNPVRQPPP